MFFLYIYDNLFRFLSSSLLSLLALSGSAGGSYSLNGNRCDTAPQTPLPLRTHTHTRAHTHAHTHTVPSVLSEPITFHFLLIIPIFPARSPSCWLSVQLKRGKVTLRVISAFHSSAACLSLSLLHLFSVVRVITTDSESICH